jgi:hypothetical protein
MTEPWEPWRRPDPWTGPDRRTPKRASSADGWLALFIIALLLLGALGAEAVFR